MSLLFVKANYLLKGAKYEFILLRALNTKSNNKKVSHSPIADPVKRGETIYEDICNVYEDMVTINTFGQHSKWRTSFVQQLAPFENMNILDAAGGTGLTTREILTQAAKAESQPNFSICLCDNSLPMIQVAKTKIKQLQGNRDLVNFVETDIHSLPFKNDTFDFATFTFSFRTGIDIDQAFKELFRVVKPNGRVGVLDFCYSPTTVQKLYNLFLDHVYSKIAYLLWRKSEAAHYIADNIRKSPSKDEVVEILKAAGFRQITTRSYMGGVAYHFIGHKINKNK